jgi:uncharacterized membrane protein required for colicin V production
MLPDSVPEAVKQSRDLRMNWVDLVVIFLVGGYAALGYWSGTVGRALGLVALYGGLFVASNMGGPGAGIILQYSATTPIVNARLLAFFGFLVLIVGLTEAFAAGYHKVLQISFVALNKPTGAVLGAVTGVVAATLIVFVIWATGNPTESYAVEGVQPSFKTSINDSAFGLYIVNNWSPTLRILFRPVLPHDPQIFFSSKPTD